MNALSVIDGWERHVLESAGVAKLKTVRSYMGTAPTSLVLAGGAVRDAYYGREIKDLDFMVNRTEADAALDSIDIVFGVRLRPCLGATPHEYEDGDRSLLSVYESRDKRINLLICTRVMDRIDEFPDSISKVWTTGSAVYATEDFFFTKATGKIKTYDRFTEERRERLSAKYPNHTFIKG
jgi:hypothetical protein